MNMEISIDGKPIEEYTTRELVVLKHSPIFNINERAMIDDVITGKIEGGVTAEEEKDMSECEDCGDMFDNKDLIPYKYEPDIKLCDGCHDNRMEEDE